MATNVCPDCQAAAALASRRTLAHARPAAAAFDASRSAWRFAFDAARTAAALAPLS